VNPYVTPTRALAPHARSRDDPSSTLGSPFRVHFENRTREDWDATLEAIAIAESQSKMGAGRTPASRCLGCLNEVIHTANVLASPFPAFFSRRKHLKDGDLAIESENRSAFEVRGTMVI